MHDENEGVMGNDEFELNEDTDLDSAANFEAEEEDSYDPDDRYH